MSIFLRELGGTPEGSWSPNVDVYRSRLGWVLKFDLAGVKKDDVSVEVRPGAIRVRGVRRDWMMERGWSHHSMEISYCHFERTVQRPCRLDEASISSEYTEGMLLVSIDAKGKSGE